MILSFLLLSSLMFHSVERPMLVTSQGMIESGLKPNAKGKAGEKGAYQVREKEWGKVPKNLSDQTKQNERILDELLKSNKGNYFKAVTAYNGKGKRAKKYAKTVLCKAVRINILGIKEG